MVNELVENNFVPNRLSTDTYHFRTRLRLSRKLRICYVLWTPQLLDIQTCSRILLRIFSSSWNKNN